MLPLLRKRETRMKRVSLAPAQLPLNDLVAADALRLSEWIRLRKVSCREVMSAFLDHIERVNTQANAILSLRERTTLLAEADERDARLARGKYLGWTHGMPRAAGISVIMQGDAAVHFSDGMQLFTCFKNQSLIGPTIALSA